MGEVIQIASDRSPERISLEPSGVQEPVRNRRLFQRLLRVFAVDRAVAAAVLGRLWQSIAGILTLIIVLRYFTPTIQGYFQTFLSLVALQAFVELGLLGVI